MPQSGLMSIDELEIAELLIGQQNAAVAAAGRVLLAGDRAVFDLPIAAGAVADFRRVLVPAGERFAVEQLDPGFHRSGVSEAMQQWQRDGSGGCLDEITSGRLAHETPIFNSREQTCSR